MELINVWFVVLAVLWAGFFFLEGFDFGVGVLANTLGRNEEERTQALAAIGPVWDADEVWLITGAAAIFAAFPGWYATWFPAAYLPLLLIIVCLVVRAVSIEYRLKRSAPRWRRRWDRGIAIASAALPFLFGLAWAGMVHGLPISSTGLPMLTGLEIITPYSLLGGFVLLSYSLAHGATFLALKTAGGVEQRARTASTRLIAIAGALMTVFAIWTYLQYSDGDLIALIFGALSVLALAIALFFSHRHQYALAFWLNGAAVLGYTASLFIALFPNAVPSTVDAAYDLTLSAAAANQYSLTVMTVVTVIAFPVVLAYQAWSFWVFRGRVKPGTAETY